MRFLKTLLLALLILGLAVFVVLQYRGHTRKAWKNAALTHLAEDVKNPAWVVGSESGKDVAVTGWLVAEV